MREFIRAMKALSDPNRVKIVKILQYKELCVCELRELLNIAQPTVSKHLKVLEDAGLVVAEKDGLWVNYKLSDGGDSPYAAVLLGNLRHWLKENREIGEIVENLKSVSRENICRR